MMKYKIYLIVPNCKFFLNTYITLTYRSDYALHKVSADHLLNYHADL